MSSNSITFKDLCLLHERDPQGASRSLSNEELNNPDYLMTWADLQYMMKGGYYDAIIPLLHETGRLDDEKYEYWLKVQKFLKHRSQYAHVRWGEVGAYSDIYQVVWGYERDTNYQKLYRGQYDATWKLESSLLRTAKTNTLNIQILMDRVRLTEAFLSALRPKQVELLGKKLSEEELLAIAQHFGFPTPLVDYTRSLRIAAWFATAEAKFLNPNDPPKVGVIYYMTTPDNSHIRNNVSAPIGFDLLDLAGIQLGKLEIVEPDIPFDDNRIHRQQGVFVSGFNPNEFQKILIDMIYFQQKPGVVFEDHRSGINETTLLPRETPLYNLAQSVKEEFNSSPRFIISKLIGDTKFAQPSLIGSAGSILYAQIESAKQFFDTLGSKLIHIGKPEDIEYFKEIFESFFLQVQLEAKLTRAVPISAGETTTKAVALAVDKLAKWSTADNESLWNAIYANLDGGPSDYTSGYPNREPKLRPSNIKEEIAMGCGLYLAAWEHLRHVDGQRARRLAGDARLWIMGTFSSPPDEKY